MTMTDPIADMLTRIRNANQNRSEFVVMPASKIKLEVLRVMKEDGFINDVEFIESGVQGSIKVALKYTDKKERVIKGIRRISKPGLRVYAKSTEMPKVLNGLGTAIVSTPNGVMTDREARHQHLGGEILAYIW